MYMHESNMAVKLLVHKDNLFYSLMEKYLAFWDQNIADKHLCTKFSLS